MEIAAGSCIMQRYGAGRARWSTRQILEFTRISTSSRSERDWHADWTRARCRSRLRGTAVVIENARDVGPSVVFARCARRLAGRVEALEARLADGDDAAWREYVEAVKVLVLAVSNLTPERRGIYLTTAQMAERLNLSPKTLLKHKASGKIRPAVQQGKLIRWKGTEELIAEPGVNGRLIGRGREG